MEANRLPSLQAALRRVNCSIDKELNLAANLPAASIPDADVESTNATIAAQIATLKDLLSRYESIANQITQFDADRDQDDVDEEGDRIMETVTTITKCCAKLAVYHGTLRARVAPSANGVDLNTSPASSTGLERQLERLIELQVMRNEARSAGSEGTGSSGSSIKLPKLSFDHFSGNILKWGEFWASFESAVDKNPKLTNAEKLSYLKAQLDGVAKSTLSGLALINENYAVAVQMLKQRFGDRQTVITAHYSQLMELSAVPNFTPKIRFLCDEVERHLRSLKALGEDTNHRHFVSLIMAKLPREMIQKLEEMKGIDDVWSVDLLRKKVQAHLAARESADRQKVTFQQKSDSSSNSSNTNRASSSKFKGTTEALVTKESSGQSTRMRCIFCEDSHWNDECPKYKTLEDRKNRIKGRCYICFSKSHAVRDCRVDKKCFHCSKAKHHHRSICPTKFGEKRGEAATVAADSTNSAEQNQCTDSSEKSNSESSLLACGEKVLLQTAQTGIRAESERGWVRTRLLLDTATHRSYISEKLASQLKLKCTSKEVISVNTFASTRAKDIETKIAKVSLQTGDGSTVEIDVNIVPRITGEISRSPVNFKHKSFLWKNLPLADVIPTEREISTIDVLVGNDYYLDFVTGEKIKLQQGLYLLGSTFGWILSGRFTPSNTEKGIRSSDALLSVLCHTNQCQRETALFSQADEPYQKPPKIEDFWLLEGIGIKDSPEITDDDKAIENFNRTVKFEDSRYQVTWPRKCENQVKSQ